MPLWNYLRGGGKRAMAVWHRRAGKDEICLHHTAICAVERVANYAYCLPEFLQGRRAIWTAVNPHTGVRRIDEAFPLSMRASTNDTTMSIRFLTGSTFSVIGSDQYDTSMVGSSYAGVTFSEYALSNPSVWAYTRPMLEENDGWAIFITTPRGKNHAYEMFNYAAKTKSWFCELLTVKDTDTLSDETLAETLAEMQSLYGEDQGTASYRQELFCDWTASVLGSFYGGLMQDVRDEGRVLAIEPPPGTPVHRAWDLGVGHSTSIWFFAVVGPQVHVYDHYVTSGVGLEHYRDHIEKLYAQRGWHHGTDWVPHDAKVKELGTGRTRVETMMRLGLNPQLAPDASLDDGINAVRHTLPLAVFHPRCDEGDLPGLGGLEQYRREWDDEKKTFKRSAVEDWTTDIADSFRYLSLSWRKAPPREIKVPRAQGWQIPPPDEPRRGGIQL
jgi:phage terminase large subunit